MAFLGRLANRGPRHKNLKITVQSTVSDIDKGMKLIAAEASKLDGKYVKIGITSKHANKMYRSGASLVKVAAMNEYGEGKTPERSFERSTFDADNRKWANRMTRYMRRKPATETFDPDVLDFIGEVIQKSIKKTIRNKSIPPNARTTIARKGFNNPLIETKMLLMSIDTEKGGGI